MLRMKVNFRPINNAAIKDDRPTPNMNTMHPKGRHKHTVREADSHTLYEPLRPLQGAERSGIHLKVGATESFKDISNNIFIWFDDWLLHATNFTRHMSIVDKFLAL